jgi:DNA uptake protein ComE-like DNA-binding protein
MSKGLYREFYLLPRGEQRALLLLSLLLIFSLLFRTVVQLLPAREPAGMEAFEQEARMIMASLAQADSLQEAKRDSIRRKRGGPEPYLTYTPQVKRAHADLPIDLNRADSAMLLPLPGIGPVFSGRIIKYRKLLGGYVSVAQLNEVYGLKEETVDLIQDRLLVDTMTLIRLDLNHATFRELLKHPYLEYTDVKALFAYRDFAGTIHSVRELQDNFILADSVLQKVLPYFVSGDIKK